jgi:ABC-type bacteriocin/lantibiotic exporter with double-glycine peptidase domain
LTGIARSLANKPRILFLDEAIRSLDNQTQAFVRESLAGNCRHTGGYRSSPEHH